MVHMNALYYGDNLEILRRYIKDETVDLVYLDPPFNSQANYNVLFAEQDGTRSAAQIKAFGDTWEWNQASAEAYQQIVESGLAISRTMQAFRLILGDSNMLAYLAMMAPRLLELRRVLRPTGSIYLHCDPTASHYLKLVMDSVFRPDNFRNEIIWKRKAGRGETNKAAIRFGVSHDTLLFYTKGPSTPFTRQYRESNPDYIASKFVHVDQAGRRYRLDNLTSPSYRANLIYAYKGYKPPEKGWAVSRKRMQEMESQGRLYFPKNMNRRIQRKRFLDELEGETVDTLWDDIPPINSQAQERLGYPTQKPEALLERIITASSQDGSVVLDPFCGCGTAIAVAERLKRQWIGVDVTHLAITLIRHRLQNQFGPAIKERYRVIGEPVSLPDAETLAGADPYQFQWWALGLVGARPTEQKKGADKGIDGRLYFHDDLKGKTKQIIFSVKAGHVSVPHVRDLRGVLDREQAEIGALLALEEPTQPMRSEAASAGFYQAPSGKRYARIQLLTVAQLLEGRGIDYPPEQERMDATFKKAPRVKTAPVENEDLPF